MHRRVRIVEPIRCPQCGGRMARFTNGQGWKLCIDCGEKIPTESGLREELDGENKRQDSVRKSRESS